MNNKKFTAQFLKYLKESSRKGKTIASLKILPHSSDCKKNELKLIIDERSYSLYFNVLHYKSQFATFINLRDESPGIVSYSPVQLTLSPTNFRVSGKRFELIQNRGITIGRGQPGLRDQFFELMYEHGFNHDNVICSGSILAPNWRLITNDFFTWLTMRLRIKKKLEGDYRQSEEQELENVSEGDKVIKAHIILEQSIRNSAVVRKKKLLATKQRRLHCECCKFDFAKAYGSHGLGYIECHHIKPINEGARVTSLNDLCLVCANCHRMLHRRLPNENLPTLNDIKKRLNNNRR